MKKITVYIFILFIAISCTKNNEIIPEATVIGRWNLKGFEGKVMYEFTNNKRFTYYSTDGNFPSLNEFMSQNPAINGLDWWYDGDKVTVDLNFGNTTTLRPNFVCNNNVILWANDNGETQQIYFREGYSLDECNIF